MTRGIRDEGQAAVELALVLPLVVVLLLAVVQVALVAKDQVLVVHAAREAVRVAVVERDPGPVARRRVQQDLGLKTAEVDVETSYRSKPVNVEVTVRYRSATVVPIVGRLLPDITLTAKAAMRSELDIKREETSG